MERAAWLKKVRDQMEALYDLVAPAYWITFGLYSNAAHRRFLARFLERLAPRGALLDAGCGAGRYDGLLLEAGHSVLGIDQSSRMLARAREHYPPERFPELRYAQVRLQEMDFQADFDGAICVDALEHVFPEDWPGIVARFEQALRPGGPLYVSVELPTPGEVQESYEHARTLGLPVVHGEVADAIDAAYAQIAPLDWRAISREQAGAAAYHYYPTMEQVRTWFDQAGLLIEEEGTGEGYAHFLARKRA